LTKLTVPRGFFGGAESKMAEGQCSRMFTVMRARDLSALVE